MKPTLNDVQSLATDLAAHHVSYNRNHILREVTLTLENYPEPRDDFAHQLARQIQRNETLVEHFNQLKKQLTKPNLRVTQLYAPIMLALVILAIASYPRTLVLALLAALGLLATLWYQSARADIKNRQRWYDVHLKPLEPVVAHGQQLTERLTYTWKNPYARISLLSNTTAPQEIHLMGLLVNLKTRQDLLKDGVSEEHIEPLTNTTREQLENFQRQLMTPINVADTTLIETPER